MNSEEGKVSWYWPESWKSVSVQTLLWPTTFPPLFPKNNIDIFDVTHTPSDCLFHRNGCHRFNTLNLFCFVSQLSIIIHRLWKIQITSAISNKVNANLYVLLYFPSSLILSLALPLFLSLLSLSHSVASSLSLIILAWILNRMNQRLQRLS